MAPTCSDGAASLVESASTFRTGSRLYHCGTPPVLMHIGDGMYGAVIVDPKDGRPTDREFVVVQSEFYGAGGDYKAMLNNPPDVVCFNGQAFRYQTTPLTAKAGKLVRFFVMNAGPSSTSGRTRS